MMEVIEVNDIDELANYRLLWNSLLAATPEATFVLTCEWLETLWRHFGAEQKLRVLIVYAAGEPIGILPLCVRREKYRLSTVRVLTYPLDDWSTWYRPIGPNPASTMMAAMQHIRRTPRDWDMMELRWVADDATCAGKSARALRIAGMLSQKQEYKTTSIADLPTDFDEFIASKSRNSRSQFRRQQRRIFEEHGAEFIRYRPAPTGEGGGDPRWDLYAMCEQVAATSWQSRVTNGNTLTHERVRDFYRDAHAAAARAGMLDVALLVLDGNPVAFLYDYHYHGHVTLLRMGFDPAYRDDGVGSALLLRTIQDSIQRGDRLIDFGPGEREHKRRLRTRVESTYRLTYTPGASWRAQSVRWSRWAKSQFKRSHAPAETVPA